MAVVIGNISVNKDKLVFNERGYAELTVFIRDEVSQYGQNISVVNRQTKEEREAKAAKVYVGNGKVTYVDDAGGIVEAPRDEMRVTTEKSSMAGREVASPDLPF